MATGAGPAPLSLTVRLTVGHPAPLALRDQDIAGDDDLYAILPEREPQAQALHPGAGALLHPAALSAVAGSARRLLALAGASPGADVGVLSRAMQELERLAAGGTATDRVVEQSTSASTAADMDIDSAVTSDQLLGGGGATAAMGRDPGAKRKLEAAGTFQRPAKRRILAWRGRQYRSSVAKAQATARRRRASSRRAPMRPRRKAGSWMGVQQQLARTSLGDGGLHRWSPGGGGGGPAEQ